MNQINPLVLLAGLAGVVGVGALAASAAAQASASLPHVTHWTLNVLPESGVSGQWDLWVTAIDGKSGHDMLATIPGGQYIYIPAALVQAQDPSKDWTYTFTPRGANRTYSLVVPTDILKAYRAYPKNLATRGVITGHTALTYEMFHPEADPCAALDPNNIVAQIKSAISSFPADGSDASAYVGWAASNIAKLISDGQHIADCISSGKINDPGEFQTILNQLISLGAQAAAKGGQAAANAIFSSSDSGSSSDGGFSSSDSGSPSDMTSSDSSSEDSSSSDSTS